MFLHRVERSWKMIYNDIHHTASGFYGSTRITKKGPLMAVVLFSVHYSEVIGGGGGGGGARRRRAGGACLGCRGGSPGRRGGGRR